MAARKKPKKKKKKKKKDDDHPSLDIVSSRGTELSGKKIVLCVAGSVAAYKAIELARLLMRHGADVTCVASSAVTKLIRPDYFRWATGNDVVTKLTGELEHIKLADYGQSDLLIVYPGTANTLGKLANGIDDTPISTVLTVGFGSRIPILMCLAMHESMYENSAVRKNMDFLKSKVQFVDPQMIEGKAKAPEPEHVLEKVLTKFGSSPVLKDKKVLMTAGPTIEYIDPVRIVTNVSTGKTGVLLASELVSAGARVSMIYGPGNEKPPRGAKITNVKTSKEMYDATKRELEKKFDLVIMAAAASDYTPSSFSKSKIKSTKKFLSIRLKKVPKIIDLVKKSQKNTFLIGFKAETDISQSGLIRAARKKMSDSDADMIIANDIGRKYRKNPQMNNVLIIDRDSVKSSGWKKKENIAKFIRKEIENKLR